MRTDAALFVTLVVLGSTACEEVTGGSGGGEAAWEPTTKPAPPAIEADRPAERGPCDPHTVKMSNGMVIEVPVECIEEGIDKGDPPPAEGKQPGEDVINPPHAAQQGWSG